MMSNIINSTMRYGLVLGLLFSLNFLLSVTGNPLLGMLTYLLAGIILYLTYRYSVQYREKECGGAISFGHGFGFVLLLYLFASIISAFVKYFYLKFFANNFLDELYNQSISVIEQILPSVPEEMYEGMEVITSAQGYTMLTTWSNILISILVGIIIAAIVRKNKSPFDGNSSSNL